MLYWLQMFFLLVYERCVFSNTIFTQAVSSVVIIEEYEQDRVEKTVIFIKTRFKPVPTSNFDYGVNCTVSMSRGFS